MKTKLNIFEKKIRAKKAQFWSLDVAIALVILVIVIIGFIVFFNQYQKKQFKNLVYDNELLSEQFALDEDNANISIYPDDEISEERVLYVNSTRYEALKSELGLESDFCLHFETLDGRVISVDGVYVLGDGETKVSIGESLFACNNTNISALSP